MKLTRGLRQHFTMKGDPKRAYTKEEARRAARAHHKNAYRCRTCKHWHIGGRA